MPHRPAPINTSIRFTESKVMPVNVPISPADTIASGYSSITAYYPVPSANKSSCTQRSAPKSQQRSQTGTTKSQPARQAYPLPTPSTKFCLALYPYTDPDPAALSFRKGDVIEIISQHPSGWWDGMAGGSWNGYGLGGNVRRGWVPSNYVRLLSGREEARSAALAQQQARTQSPQQQQSIVTPSSKEH